MNPLLIFILIASELSLILAHLGIFRIWPLAIAGLSALFVYPRCSKTGLGHIKWLLPVLGIAFFLFFRPYQYMDGGWDPGSYVNTGVHIAQTGGVIYNDEIVNEYPGLYIKDRDRGLVVPQFFHLYPVWIAIFYKLFGLKSVFYVNPFFALLNVILVFLIGKKLMGKRYGIIAALLLCLNIIEIWNARFSISEILSQFLLLAGFYFLLEDNRASLFWAGVSFGEFLLVNITSVLIIPVLIIYFIHRANKRDIYFIIPFLFFLGRLVIQLCTYSSIYLGNVIVFFQRSEIYYGILLFIALLFIWKINYRVIAFSVPLFFIYGYFIRPRISGSIEALNLVELGNYLTLPGLILGAIGIMAVIYKKKDEKMALFALIALVYAVFFLFDKRMNTRYPFSFRRYSAVVIPAYCLFTAYAGRFSRIISLGLIPFVIAVPLYRCRDIITVKDHNGWLGFWTEFAGRMDPNALYVSNNYRWARPLSDIFGKKVTVSKRFIKEGRYYISDNNKPYSLDVDFIEVYSQSYKGEYLEHSKTFPPKRRMRGFNFKIYKTDKIGVPGRDEYFVDIGREDIGLLSGFDKARRFRGIEGTARWTFGEARMVIPLPGDFLTICASGMPKEAGESVISLYINDKPIVEDYRISEEMKEHVFKILAIESGRRAVLKIKSTTWSPNKYGIKGFPDGLGILLDWVKVRGEYS